MTYNDNSQQSNGVRATQKSTTKVNNPYGQGLSYNSDLLLFPVPMEVYSSVNFSTVDGANKNSEAFHGYATGNHSSAKYINGNGYSANGQVLQPPMNAIDWNGRIDFKHVPGGCRAPCCSQMKYSSDMNMFPDAHRCRCVIFPGNM